MLERSQAKPLVAAFNDGPEVSVEWTNPVTGEVFEPAFAGHGKRDAYSAISYDDGNSWRRTNVSQSGATAVGPIFLVDHTDKYICQPALKPGELPTADKCDYFIYGDDPVQEVGDPAYPHLIEENKLAGGDVINVQQAVIGNHILVAWVSRMCTGGVSPLDNIATGSNPYGILGLQDYIDYGLQKADGELGASEINAIREIGKVPYTCLWVRRGRIIDDTTTGGTKVQWWPAERLTSGVRDAFKLEVAGTENAGFAVVWQEDPDGLLPGSGEGPGEGWSGSTVNHKTDIWYSFLHLKDFATPVGTPVMSVPVPITDNGKCPLSSGESGKQYCYADNMGYDPATGWTAGANGTPDLCADGDLIYNSCIAEDGRYIEGQTGASRPRMNLQAYCVGNDDPATWATSCTDFSQWSAWAAITAEESKGKGDLVDEGGNTLEIGKNAWFYTFDFQQPQPIKQGLLMNAPTKRWPGFKVDSMVYDSSLDDPAAPFDPVNPWQPAYDSYIVYRPQIFGNGIWYTPFYDTEIARRTALASQGVKAAYDSTAKVSMVGIFKQGVMNQGGPADIMIRRFVLPEGFNPGGDNPFDYKNMSCSHWATAAELGVVNNPDFVTNGLPNPNYLEGLCLEPTINVSATTPTRCDGNTVTDLTGVGCGYQATMPFLDKDPSVLVPRTFNWTQTQGTAEVTDGPINNLDDESWENAFDVAKGHRGFLSGDMIMMQYAWAPNWKPNVIGRDTYNLYIRRSFDGGATWTTTPVDKGGDGTMTCENYRVPVNGDIGTAGVTVTTPVCTTYAAGAREPARDLSLIRLRAPLPFNYPLRTVLDPRYSPTGGLLKHASTAFTLDGNVLVPQAPYTGIGGDTRDPSKFYISYDDGDNRTVDYGEAEPLYMYYTLAYNWGDDYTGTTVTVPTGTFTAMQLLNLTGTNASESSITGNPDGSFLYSIWNQWQYSDPTDYQVGVYDSDVINEDAYFRRIMFLDGE